MDDDGEGIARACQIVERFGAVVIAADDALNGDARNLRGQRLRERATGALRHGRDPDHGDDGDQNRDDPPEGELSPQTAAIDNMIGIERHGMSPELMCRRVQP